MGKSQDYEMKLYSKRTLIKPILEKDIPAIIDMYNERDSFKYVKALDGKSDDFYERFLQNKIESNRNDIGFWVVKEKKSLEFIGTVNLNQFASTSMIHMGCHLKRKFWNNGFATELLKRILDYGIKEKKLQEVFGIFDEENSVSRRLLEKMEFKYFEDQTFLDTKVIVYRYMSKGLSK
ncbi:GNAT family N-acetyltransferase [Mesonia sp.]|uniref:GNAT family N-acetyltransferase n=1 Tax=Mesonia sp. TaxID=1960830 RepID=UPI003F9825A1